MDWIGEWKGKECGGIVSFRCSRFRGDGGFEWYKWVFGTVIRTVLGLGRWVRIGWYIVAFVMKKGIAFVFCSRGFHARI